MMEESATLAVRSEMIKTAFQAQGKTGPMTEMVLGEGIWRA